MADFVILHAPADVDRARALAQQLVGGLALSVPVTPGAHASFGRDVVRVTIWSQAAAPHASAFASLMNGGVSVVISFDDTPLDPQVNVMSHSAIEATSDPLGTGRAVAAAAALAARALRTLNRETAKRPAELLFEAAGAAPSGRRPSAWRRVALATGVGAGATAISLATVAGYAAYQTDPLRLGSAPAIEPADARAAMRSEALVRAAFGSTMEADISLAARVLPQEATDEIAMRVTATLGASKEKSQRQVERFEELQGLVVTTSRVAPVKASPPAPSQALPSVVLSAVDQIEGDFVMDRMAEIAAPLEPIG